MQSPNHLEGIARMALERANMDDPVDILLLAHRRGLKLRYSSSPKARIDKGVILVPAKYGLRPQRASFSVAHEVAHHVLREYGVDRSAPEEGCTSDEIEAAADYLAGCLLLPREAFLRALAATDWDLFDLIKLYQGSSAQAICIRMTQVSPSATASIWDAGHCHRAYGASMEDLEAMDREVAAHVLAAQAPIRGDVAAWPVTDHRWHRVCVVRRAA